MEKKLLFALDIGTRSVVGLVGEQTPGGITVIAFERQEHHTRAMLDGQIHDVPEVAQVLASVKQRLVDKVGPLKKVSVAAAGRALCTVKASAEIDCSGRGALSNEDERALELAAIQAAQHQLATGNDVADPASYYCVGYSVVRFTLDNAPIKSLSGQRGKTAGIEVIATFLPRQVIDSLQSAIQEVDLEIATLTLEPIAAISVLIPTTMRHLNLTLVDVGAGTSDVAITRDGSVVAYGMVPCAGDEITEAISHEYLLDFKVAEVLKRQLGGGKNKKVSFNDVLGSTHKVSAQAIIDRITPAVAGLAKAIAAQILALNTTPPQAVLLVGGGSLTPSLPEELAKALDIASSRVAIRQPDAVDGLHSIPDRLRAPDGVTPLGILKLAGSRTLNFVHVTLNDQPLRLFNLGKLSVADALLVAGIDVRSLQGRPGLAITIIINGQKKFIPGTMGQAGHIQVNGGDATFSDMLQEGDIICVKKGIDGQSPTPLLRDVISVPAPFTVTINDRPVAVEAIITVNNAAAKLDTRLADRDQVVCRLPANLAEVLAAVGMSTDPIEHRYTINGVDRTFTRRPEYLINGKKANMNDAVPANTSITIPPLPPMTLAELLGLGEGTGEYYTVSFNDTDCRVPIRRYTFTVGGRPAKPTDPVPPGSTVDYSCYEVQPMVSDVLLAAEFDPRSLPATARFDLQVNGQPAEYTTPVKNGDQINITLTQNQ